MQVTIIVCTSSPPMNFHVEIFVKWSVFVLNIRELLVEDKVAMPAPVCLSKCHHLAEALHKVTAIGLCRETPGGAAEASVSPDRLLCCESLVMESWGCGEHGGGGRVWRARGVWRARVVSGGIAGRFQGAHCQVRCAAAPHILRPRVSGGRERTDRVSHCPQCPLLSKITSANKSLHYYYYYYFS